MHGSPKYRDENNEGLSQYWREFYQLLCYCFNVYFWVIHKNIYKWHRTGITELWSRLYICLPHSCLADIATEWCHLIQQMYGGLHVIASFSRNHSAHCDRVIHGPLARYVDLRVVAHAPGKPGTFSSPPRVRNPDMHPGTCVTHVSWCMAGSLTSDLLWSRWRGNVPGIPSACTTRNLGIWVEAHVCVSNLTNPPRHKCLLSVFSTNLN